MKQLTIKNRVESVGIGLHKGKPVKIEFEPLDANSGIIFYRKDLAVSIEATPKNVVNTQMATVLGKDGATISTVEHLLSAIYSYGIDNIRIIVDGPEIPVMDGSAASFCLLLDEAGISELEESKKTMIVKKEIEVKSGDKYAKLMPSKTSIYDFTIKFDHPIIKKQSFRFNFSKKDFIEEISRARTFGFLKDVQMLRANNLALGGSLDNAIVLDDKKILNPDGLRFEKEFVKHKILDAIGDLAIIGHPIIGHYEAYASSHGLNHELSKKLLSSQANYEIVSASEAREYALQKVFA